MRLSSLVRPFPSPLVWILSTASWCRPPLCMVSILLCSSGKASCIALSISASSSWVASFILDCAVSLACFSPSPFLSLSGMSFTSSATLRIRPLALATASSISPRREVADWLMVLMFWL